MRVAVVQIRIVRVLVAKGVVGVRVSMRLTRWIFGGVSVLVVRVVDVSVQMIERFVFMPVVVLLSQVEPNTKRHQCCRSR